MVFLTRFVSQGSHAERPSWSCFHERFSVGRVCGEGSEFRR